MHSLGCDVLCHYASLSNCYVFRYPTTLAQCAASCRQPPTAAAAAAAGQQYKGDIGKALQSLVTFGSSALNQLFHPAALLHPAAAAIGSAQQQVHSISTQLQDCGFFAKFPDRMLNAAKQLQDRVTAAKQAAAEAGVAGSNSIRTAGGSADSTTEPRIELAPDQALARACNGLLNCCALLEWLHEQHAGGLPAMAAARNAVIALCIAVLQQDSVRLANMPAGVTPLDPYQLVVWPNSRQAFRTLHQQAQFLAYGSTESNSPAARLSHPNVHQL